MNTVFVVVERVNGEVNYLGAYDNYSSAVCCVVTCFQVNPRLSYLYIEKHTFGEKVVSECFNRNL